MNPSRKTHAGTTANALVQACGSEQAANNYLAIFQDQHGPDPRAWPPIENRD